MSTTSVKNRKPRAPKTEAPTIEAPTTEAPSAYERLSALLEQGAVLSSVIQDAAVNMLTSMSVMDKAGNLANAELVRVLERPWTGLNRNQFIRWIHAHSPVRVKVKGNGQIEKLRWSESWVKSRKSEGLPTFDLTGAAVDQWYEESAETTRALKIPKPDALIVSLVAQLARRMHAKGLTGRECADEFMKAIGDPVAFATRLIEYSIESEKHQSWCSRWDAENPAK